MTARGMVLVFAGLLVAAGGTGLDARQRSVADAVPPANAVARGESLSVGEYRRWVRVNPKPHRVFSHLALLCRPATLDEKAGEAADPHRDKFVTVYVNEVARQAMLRDKAPRFPVGSVIVKEKLAGPDSAKPELLTVMRKQRDGYDPPGGDWEYAVLDGAGRRMGEPGRLAACRSCHTQWRNTDYVSRAYLSEPQRRQLK